MIVAVTGVSGLLGSHVAEALADDGHQVLGMTTQKALKPTQTLRICRPNYEDSEELKHILVRESIDVLIHCAAVTNLQVCEEHPQKAHRINTQMAKNLADVCDALGVHYVYISTDCVYQESDTPVTEASSVNPLNHYAQSKLAAEYLLSKKHLILRVNFFGRSKSQQGGALVDWILKNFENGQVITGFSDVFFSPLYVRTLARFIVKACEQKLSGTYNVGAKDGMDKYRFALMLSRTLGYDESLVQEGSLDQFQSSVKRPKKIIMGSSRFAQALGIELPTITDDIKAFYRDYLADRAFTRQQEVCDGI